MRARVVVLVLAIGGCGGSGAPVGVAGATSPAGAAGTAGNTTIGSGGGSGSPGVAGASGMGGNGTSCGIQQAMCNGTCIGVWEDDRNCGQCGVTCTGDKHCAAGMCQTSKIQHVVLIVQERGDSRDRLYAS